LGGSIACQPDFLDPFALELLVGVDFLKSKQKSFAKGWDVERLGISQRHLHGIDVANDVVARTIGPNDLHDGDQVLVRADGDRLSVVVDLAPAAVFLEPTPAIVNAIRESGGYARGTIQAAYPTLGLITVQLR
jgi:hypothetical protein